jgi:hypothetical protein
MSNHYDILLQKPSSNVHEARIGSITRYYGCVSDLYGKADCIGVKNRERCFSHWSRYLSMCAIGQIRDIIEIYPAPSGCCVTVTGTAVLFKRVFISLERRYHTNSASRAPRSATDRCF